MSIPDGFQPVLRYTVKNCALVRWNKLNDDLLAKRNCVYVRVVRGKVVYVGKSKGRLIARLKRHLAIVSSPKTQDQKRYRDYIEGKSCTIFAMVAPMRRVANMRFNVCHSLEEYLITTLEPKFNRRLG